MYTQCPDCLTVYKVGPDPVAEGRGRLRCGHCGTVFDALATLTEALPAEYFELLPARAAAGVPPVLQVPAMHPTRASGQAQLDQPAATQLPGEWLAAADLQDLPSLHTERPGFGARTPLPRNRDRVRERSPEGPTGRAADGYTFSPGAPRDAAEPTRPARGAARRNSPQRVEPAATDRPSAAWSWACGLLFMTLVGQVLWLERERIYAHPGLRPGLEQACATVGCQVPLPRNLDGLRLLAREVRPHEHLQGALVISGTLKNDGMIPAPFPIVEVRLADLNDRVVAMRRFRPEEYLADRQAIGRGFPGQSSLPLLFEVADPGQNALAFEFEFRLPQ